MGTVGINSEDVINIEKSEIHKPKKRKSLGLNFKNILNNFNLEDLILFGLLFLLIEEGVEDEFLILILVVLLLTDPD